MERSAIKKLLDKQEIIETHSRYAKGLDTRDSKLYRSVFTETIHLDFSSVGLGDPSSSTADQWVSDAFEFTSNFSGTQHMITNHLIDLDGDAADCTAYVRAHHFSADGVITMWGYYTNRLVRRSEGWKIESLKFTLFEQSGGGEGAKS